MKIHQGIVLRSVFWVLGGTFAGLASGVVLTLLYARFIGPDDPPIGVGLLYLFALALCSCMGLIVGIIRVSDL